MSPPSARPSSNCAPASAGLFAVAENYPQLKSDETFKQLQGRIIALEESIADRRELYNDQVNLNNIRVKVFPDVIIAQKFGFLPAQLLEFAERGKARRRRRRAVRHIALRTPRQDPSGHVRQSIQILGSWLLGLAAAAVYSFWYAFKAWRQKSHHRGHAHIAGALRRAGLCRTHRAAACRRRIPPTRRR